MKNSRPERGGVRHTREEQRHPRGRRCKGVQALLEDQNMARRRPQLMGAAKRGWELQSSGAAPADLVKMFAFNW